MGKEVIKYEFYEIYKTRWDAANVCVFQLKDEDGNLIDKWRMARLDLDERCYTWDGPIYDEEPIPKGINIMTLHMEEDAFEVMKYFHLKYDKERRGYFEPTKMPKIERFRKKGRL